MNAEIENGKLVVRATNETESFALETWAKQNGVCVDKDLGFSASQLRFLAYEVYSRVSGPPNILLKLREAFLC